MNSPNRPASPSSTASSDTPPPEEASLAPITPKRPLSGNAGGGSKSRRKFEHGLTSRRTYTYDGKESMNVSRREEFVDVTATEKLRKMIGDPFDDSVLISLA